MSPANKPRRADKAEAFARRMQAALDVVPSAIAVWNRRDQLIFANESYIELAQRKDKTIPPNTTFEALLREFVSGGTIVAPSRDLNAFLEDRLRMHRAGTGTMEVMSHAGRWLQINESRTLEGGVVTCVTDVTAIHERESILRERHELFESTLAILDQGLSVFDPDLRLRLWNKRFVELCNLPESMATVGTSIEDMFRYWIGCGVFGPGDPAAILHEKMAAVRQPGKATSTWCNERGQTLLVTSDRSPDRGLVATLTDITEVRRQDQALSDSERRLGAVADNLPGIVYQRVLRADGSVVYPYISDAVRKIYGSEMTPQRIQQEPTIFYSSIDPRDGADFAASFRKSAAELSEWDHEFRIITMDRAEKWMRGRSRPRRLDDGSIVWDGILLDITAHKAEAAEKAALQKKLDHLQKLEAIGTMVGGITHEINNALTPILMHARLALDRLPQGAREYRSLERVMEQAERIKDLVGQILAFSRLDRPEASLFDFVKCVRQVMRMLKPIIPSTISVELSLPDTELIVLANPGQLQQIMTNLITNAYQALGTQIGHIAIAVSCEATPSSPALLAADKGDAPAGYARLRVADDGPGIDKATIGRIFDPFFTTKPVGQGTGLGLSIVQSTLRNWHGAIDVTSEPGRGACFDAYVPLADSNLQSVGATVATSGMPQVASATSMAGQSV